VGRRGGLSDRCKGCGGLGTIEGSWLSDWRGKVVPFGATGIGDAGVNVDGPDIPIMVKVGSDCLRAKT
jgi:hypothetical protein